PTAAVEPYVRHLQKSGVTLDYNPQPDGVHNTAWWPEVRDSFERFVRSHPRDPYPSKITWETSGDSAARRAHWLVIDKIGRRTPKSDAPMPDANEFLSGTQTNFGVRV